MHTNPPGKKRKAFTVDDIVRVLNSMNFTAGRASLKIFRDAAIVLVGFSGGYRRGEISGFERRDIDFGIDGVVITLPRSKTDQIGVGRVGGVFRSDAPRYCAPCALARWMVLSDAYALERTDLDKLLQKFDPARATKHLCKKALKFQALSPDAPVFPSLIHNKIKKKGIPVADVNRAVQRYSVPLGYPASEYGTHSLRAGFVTTALDNGATVEEVMRQTGHKSPMMVMQYYRSHIVLSLNAGRRVTISGKRSADTKDRQVAREPHASKKPKARRKSKLRHTEPSVSDGRAKAAKLMDLTSNKVNAGGTPTRK
ncbi:hypothetical protein [Salinibacterium xinjiangense]|nr:hypothetical protein [Salinibacterium xinjiangense]